MTVRVFAVRLVTNARLPSELKVTSVAPGPTEMVLVTLPVATSMSETWLVG